MESVPITPKNFMKPASSEIAAVIFDMDGVLIDAREWHYQALNQALQLFGEKIEIDEHLSRFDGLPTKVKLEMLSREGRLPRHLHGMVNRVKQERTLRIAAQNCTPNLGHLILVGWLKSRGIRVAVATNSVRLTAEFMLNSAGLLGLMDCVQTNEDIERAKPDPSIYLSVSKLLNVPPRNCLVLEDSETGVQAASSAQMIVKRVSGPSEVNLASIRSVLSLEHR